MQAAVPDTISGTVVDNATNLPVSGASVALEQLEISGVLMPANQPVTGALVSVEQLPSVVAVPGQAGTTSLIDRVVATTTSGPDGSFIFTGLLPGNFYDVAADASVTLASGATHTYTTTITTTVPVGATLGRVPLVPEFGNSAPSGVPAQISATITTSTSSITVTQADIKLSALQGYPVQFTIPPFAGSTPQVTTAPGANCANGTDCANYTLIVPSADPVYGMFRPSGTNYTIPSDPSFQLQEVIYSVEGRAFLPGATVPDCSPTSQTAGQVVVRGTLASRIPNLNFTSCQ